MRVSIDHSTKSVGFIMKKTYPLVKVTVTFSEEEKQVIKEEKLSGYVVLESVPMGKRGDPKMQDIYYMNIYKLLDEPYEFIAENKLEANEFERQAMSQLKVFKSMLEGSKQSENKSFEL